MARKPRSSKASPKRGKADTATSVDDPVLAAALETAAALGWTTMTLADVAERGGMSLGALLLEAPTKAHLLCRFMNHIDAATLGPAATPDESQTPRDRLFEVLMRRFDALNRNREGAQAILRALRRDPAAAALGWLRLDRSALAMLAAAGVRTDGLPGFARAQGLKAIYAATLRAWMRDDTEDMAGTMAALDRHLRQAERLMRFVPFGRTRAAKTADEADAA